MNEDGGEGARGEEAPSRRATTRRHRLDPDRAAAVARASARHSPPPVVDTRRYQRMIGLFGLMLVVIIAVSFLLSRGQGTVGVPAGQKLHLFAAPLAASTLNGAANLHPHCTIAHHDPRALNVCLLVKRAPLVLAFFVTSSGVCEQQVSALQAVSHQYQRGRVQFAAVAISSSHVDTLRAVRSHRWTVPVAYDVDGRVGAAYGIAVCPIVELVRRGGTVQRRLVGGRWSSSTTLGPLVKALERAG